MIKALLHGKLSREQENMEDLLTSAVFGRLRYLEPTEALLPFLANAVTLDGGQPLSEIAGGAQVTYTFWPPYAEPGCAPCEPDLVLNVEFPIRRLLVLIEVKLHSGKSSEEDEHAESTTDQLGKEWDNLVSRAVGLNARPVLVYLTADVGIPREDMEASIAAYREKRGGDIPTLCWLSWRTLSDVLEKATERNEIENDLLALLNRHDLRWYKLRLPYSFNFGGWRFGVAAKEAR